MKYTYIAILFTAFLGISCSNNEIVLSEDKLPEDIFYLNDEISPFSGRCIVYYNNTENLKEVLNFKEGVLDGERVSYYHNGQIKRQGLYASGALHGMWKTFNEKGDQILEVEYDNDTLMGTYVSWYDTGVIREKGAYSQNVRIGTWVVFDEAGMIVKEESL